jgi:hypothetical protein
MAHLRQLLGVCPGGARSPGFDRLHASLGRGRLARAGAGHVAPGAASGRGPAATLAA